MARNKAHSDDGYIRNSVEINVLNLGLFCVIVKAIIRFKPIQYNMSRKQYRR